MSVTCVNSFRVNIGEKKFGKFDPKKDDAPIYQIASVHAGSGLLLNWNGGNV